MSKRYAIMLGTAVHHGIERLLVVNGDVHPGDIIKLLPSGQEMRAYARADAETTKKAFQRLHAPWEEFCKNCKEYSEKHANGWCLGQATKYEEITEAEWAKMKGYSGVCAPPVELRPVVPNHERREARGVARDRYEPLGGSQRGGRTRYVPPKANAPWQR